MSFTNNILVNTGDTVNIITNVSYFFESKNKDQFYLV